MRLLHHGLDPAGIHRIQGCGDDDRYDLAGSPQIVLGLCRRSSQIGPCTSTKPEPTGKRGAFGEFPLVTFATCNGRDTIVARRALNPSRLPARPFGLRRLTAKARPS